MTEDINKVFDLDLDSDINSVDSIVKDEEESSLNDIEENIEDIKFPKVVMDTKQFREFVRTARFIASSNGKDLIGQSICIEALKDKVVCRVSDLDVYFEQVIDRMDADGIEETIVVPISIINKILNAVTSKFVIYRDGEDLYIKIFGGGVLIETFSLGADKFQIKGSYIDKGSVNSSKLVKWVTDLSKVASVAMTPNEKRIIFDDGMVFASYFWACTFAEAEGMPNMDLKWKDMRVVASALSGKSCELSIGEVTSNNVKRMRISGDGFKYTFLVTESKFYAVLKKEVDRVRGRKVEGEEIKTAPIYKIIELAADLPYSSGKLGISMSNKGITANMKMKSGKVNSFELVSGGKYSGEDKSVDMQANLLRVFMSMLASKEDANIDINEDIMYMGNEDYTCIIFNDII